MHYENKNCDTDDLNREIDWESLGTFSTTDIDMDDGTKVNITDIQGEISGTIEMEGIPAALLQQFYYNGRWHDKLTRRVAKRRRYIQARWKITEADGSIRYTDATVWTVYSTPRWYNRIMLYFRTKREQRRQSKTNRT